MFLSQLITPGEEIVPTFSVNLHEQEQEYIIKDALNKIHLFLTNLKQSYIVMF